MSVPHRPVMVDEVVTALAPRRGVTLVDGTLGAGGHSAALLDAVDGDALLIGVDRDPEALELARERLARFGDAVRFVHARHESLAAVLDDEGIERVEAVLLDLGISSMQVDRAERGFSFRREATLDCRMDRTSGRPIAEWLAEVEPRELARVLRRYGDEKAATRIARAIVAEREREPLTSTTRLAEIVADAVGPSRRPGGAHVATRTFQALRIVANDEIDGLPRAIEDAVDRLALGGRIAVLSYHSLEDRAVARTLRRLAASTQPRHLPLTGDAGGGVLKLTPARALRPSDDEIAANPRARSARLRVAERVSEEKR